MKVSVAGAGGMIGGHLVKRLLEEDHTVIAVDKKRMGDWFQVYEGVQNYRMDLTEKAAAGATVWGADWVFNLAADMGGMGFISSHRVDCLHSIDISSNMIRHADEAKIGRYFYASSACVYPDYKQQTPLVELRESDAWPADPEPAYGLEKLYGEEFCKWYTQERGLETRVARYHNVYGPLTSWKDGREKAPAAICRKVAEAKVHDYNAIDIWGDGEQTRSFMYVDDCIEGTMRIMGGDYAEPLNLGSTELVTINELVTIVEEIAGIKLQRVYDLDAPQGVRGRNSENTLIKQVLGWEPTTSLRDGLQDTYKWIYDQVVADAR